MHRLGRRPPPRESISWGEWTTVARTPGIGDGFYWAIFRLWGTPRPGCIALCAKHAPHVKTSARCRCGPGGPDGRLRCLPERLAVHDPREVPRVRGGHL